MGPGPFESSSRGASFSRKFEFQSVVYKKVIKKNEKINRHNLTTKRPGNGDFAAKEIKKLYGRIAKKNSEKIRI